MSRKQRRFIFGGLLLLYFLIILFPYYWMGITSFKSTYQISSGQHLFRPNPPVLDNYRELLAGTRFAAWMRNSLVVALTSTLLVAIISCFAAYSLARFNLPGQNFVSSGILITYLVPRTILFIPLYKILIGFRLIDSLLGLILTYTAFLLPFCTWLLVGFFRNIPKEIEDCARIDGCTRMGAFLRVMLPLAMPGVMAAAIFTFTQSWNEFLYAYVFIDSVDKKTIPVGLCDLILGDFYLWGQLMTASMLTAIPVVLLFSYFSRYFVAGLTSGAVKG